MRAGLGRCRNDRIAEVASRTLHRNGYAGVGAAEVMKQAGLTHGGFYVRFESRDALLMAVLCLPVHAKPVPAST